MTTLKGKLYKLRLLEVLKIVWFGKKTRVKTQSVHRLEYYL